jgi:hypothetical protein
MFREKFGGGFANRLINKRIWEGNSLLRVNDKDRRLHLVSKL